MKKNILFLMLASVFLAGCGSKNLPKCDDEVVVQKVKDAIIPDFQAICNKGSNWVEYCNAEKGVFEAFHREEDFCVAKFSINQDGKGWKNGWWVSWVVSYKTKYENQETVVTDIDFFAH